MPAELESVDGLLDDPRLFKPFRRWFDLELGSRPDSDRVLRAIARETRRVGEVARTGRALPAYRVGN